MPSHRMNREQFHAKASALDENALRKALWTLYWRGSAQTRERIEVQLDPEEAAHKRKREPAPVAPTAVLEEIREFVGLVRKGAYLAGDRRVSPKERTRWRFTFRRLVTDAQQALQHDDVDTAATALELMIDLACDTRDHDRFRSDDPMQAAGVVVSDAVEQLWTRLRDHDGFHSFAERAAPQLVRWELPYGWTRYGFGKVAERERPLAEVLAHLLQVPDHWEAFAESYLDALDGAADHDEAAAKRHWRSREQIRRERARALAAWNQQLIDQLEATDAAELLDGLVTHPALAGTERTYLEAELAHRREEHERARELIERCLDELPGHEGFREASRRFAAG